ncbi:hypothetical protein [Parafrankia sp. CH37]|uniref:hypothetical protein n=1 Tax=Parafrankia sp. CH37 TaxID=683308 RepID=UPI001D00C239|nr:hypothetical protein [Parafrankia sp. CH37]
MQTPSTRTLPARQATVSTGSAHLPPRGTVTPPGQKVRPGGQSAVLGADEPSQQATDVLLVAAGLGHCSPTATLTGLSGH